MPREASIIPLLLACGTLPTIFYRILIQYHTSMMNDNQYHLMIMETWGGCRTHAPRHARRPGTLAAMRSKTNSFKTMAVEFADVKGGGVARLGLAALLALPMEVLELIVTAAISLRPPRGACPRSARVVRAHLVRTLSATADSLPSGPVATPVQPLPAAPAPTSLAPAVDEDVMEAWMDEAERAALRVIVEGAAGLETRAELHAGMTRRTDAAAESRDQQGSTAVEVEGRVMAAEKAINAARRGDIVPCQTLTSPAKRTGQPPSIPKTRLQNREKIRAAELEDDEAEDDAVE